MMFVVSDNYEGGNFVELRIKELRQVLFLCSFTTTKRTSIRTITEQ